MTRDKMISKLYKMALKLLKNYDSELENKMWKLCIDWNSNNYDNEIFMSEIWNENDTDIIGFAIEDDCFYW